jgi:hypothetical protein
MMQKFNLLELLNYIDPAKCSYQEWINVGFALKTENYTAADWDSWSKSDSRYKPGECFQKWNTFQGAGKEITGATITQLAKDNGWVPSSKEDRELDWDDEIGRDYVVLDKTWVEGKEIEEPEEWNPIRELTTYLETLFESSDNVSYVTTVYENADGELKPSKGNWDRTAGELIDALSKCNGDIGSILGDYKEEAGAWIRFNPVDGKGIKNDNVTEYRYALVESDSMDLEKQHALLRELELPIAALVHSGKKSIHAIVRVDAGSYEEYRKRVDYLYTVCDKNGLIIDTQNKNPSRLSRMPGVLRNGNKQFLMATNIGKATWSDWYEWVEATNDDLPEPTNLDDIWDKRPPLSPPLIENILRQGHKMLLAGPSKAGKSFALIELVIALAEGKEWLGNKCTQSKVMYVNLELDAASCFDRFANVYEALGWEPKSKNNIEIWNLRGMSEPMDKLAPKLIRRAKKLGVSAVVIDPIYKVITGDENSADQMAHFTNQFDKICTGMGAAVIYCHHHSKGAQGGKKSMDRSSGSGVFARDPDAILDLTELMISKTLKSTEENGIVSRVSVEMIRKHNPKYLSKNISQADQINSGTMSQHIDKALSKEQIQEWTDAIKDELVKQKRKTAWRIEGTLREFPSFESIDMWFDYPIHVIDQEGLLKEFKPESQLRPNERASMGKKTKTARENEAKRQIELAFDSCNLEGTGEVPLSDIAEYMDITEKTVRRKVSLHESFGIENGIVRRISSESDDE